MKITSKPFADAKSLNETIRPSTFGNENGGASVPSGDSKIAFDRSVNNAETRVYRNRSTRAAEPNASGKKRKTFYDGLGRYKGVRWIFL